MRMLSNDSVRFGRVVYCGTWIKCDMYRHVAKFHLDLAQLWRCPVSWCTVWKGTQQDCMDHVRGAHDVSWDVKSASIEKFVFPWTVRRQVWSDSLEQHHSGISTDILLFSDINLSFISAGSRISPSRGTICCGCVLCYLRRWLSLRIVCCHQFRPALCRYVRLARLSWWGSRPEEPDVPSGGYGRYVSWRDRLAIFRSS